MEQLSLQVLTPDAKLISRATEPTCIVALPVLDRGQPDGREHYITLESRPTNSLVAKLPQHSSFALCEFYITSEEH